MLTIPIYLPDKEGWLPSVSGPKQGSIIDFSKEAGVNAFPGPMPVGMCWLSFFVGQEIVI